MGFFCCGRYLWRWLEIWFLPVFGCAISPSETSVDQIYSSTEISNGGPIAPHSGPIAPQLPLLPRFCHSVSGTCTALLPHVGALLPHIAALLPHYCPPGGALLPHYGLLLPHKGALLPHIAALSPHYCPTIAPRGGPYCPTIAPIAPLMPQCIGHCYRLIAPWFPQRSPIAPPGAP